jgi:hypothetical protein
MSKNNPELKQHLINSSVKTAILFLTSNRIPQEENFDFVLAAIESFEDITEARNVLYENYFDEILEWAQYNS